MEVFQLLAATQTVIDLMDDGQRIPANFERFSGKDIGIDIDELEQSEQAGVFEFCRCAVVAGTEGDLHFRDDE